MEEYNQVSYKQYTEFFFYYWNNEQMEILCLIFLKKNIGYQSLIRISNILNGEETSMDELLENLSINDLVYFKYLKAYAPVNSVDVERPFSMFKVLLADNRQSFQFENLKKHLIVQCHFQGKSIILIKYVMAKIIFTKPWV